MVQTSHKIFIDATVFQSFIDRASTNHQKSIEVLNRLAREKAYLFTTTTEIEETYSFLDQKVSKIIAIEFLQAIAESSIEVLTPGKLDLAQASKLINENKDQRISLRKALTAVLMHKNTISKVATLGFWQNLLGIVPYL